MRAALVILLCIPAFVLLAGCAAAPAPAPGFCVAPEVMQRCGQQGGCTLVSQAWLLQLVQEVAEEVEQACKGRV